MNQIGNATDYSRSRTNIRTLTNSKFHQEVVPLHLRCSMTHIHLFLFSFSLGLLTLLGSFTLILQCQILTLGPCGTLELDGIFF